MEATNNAAGNSAHPRKEAAMFSTSLREAFASATPEACKSLIAQGFPFAVAVENQRGEWFILNAEDQGHAGTLAQHWVETMGARGASCWRLFDHGLAPKPFHTVFEQLDEDWEDAA
jgi:predicted component of type VI protein secretion system